MPRKRKLPDGMVERPGRRGYYADFYVGGRRVKKKLGTDLEAAKSILNELKARMERGEFGLLDNDYPIKDLKEAFLKRCEQEKRPATVERYGVVLNGILGWLGVQKVSQIDAARVLAYRQEKTGKHAPATINLAVVVLRSMLRWGVKQKLIGNNPLQEIQPLPNENPKEGRALADSEVGLLLKHSFPHWRDIWYALLVTGMREGELMSLCLPDIDRDARELIIRGHKAKGKRERRLPIDPGLWEILQRQVAEAPKRLPGVSSNQTMAEYLRRCFTNEHVFVSTRNSRLSRSKLYAAFMRSCKRAGIETATFDAEGNLIEHVDVHSLRRTFATNLILNGADPKTVQELLGHRTLDMTMRIYTKIKGTSKRQAIARLSYGKGANPPDHIIPLPPAANG